MVWVVVGVLLLGTAWLYNSFIRLRNRAREAFAGVDVQLKRRHDLVPNLVRVVAAYAKHENETLEEVARRRGEARHAGTMQDREQSEHGLKAAIDRILVLVEAYPELKADDNYRKLHDDLVDIEDHLQYARRYYNGAVRDFNTRIQQFPSNLLAGMFGFQAAEYFQFEEGE